MERRSSIVFGLHDSALHWPDHVAVSQADTSINFSTLWQRSASVAAFLKAEGIQRGDRVALLLNNSAEFIAIYYGVLACGGIAVSLNAAAKSRDFVAWLKHSGAGWLFGDASNSEITAALANLPVPPQFIPVGGLQNGLLREIFDSGVTSPPTAIPNEAPAAILYTSGTTGDPKGVLLSHGNLAANTSGIIEYLALSHADSILSVLPFYYSYGNSVLHTHLQAGGTLHLEANMVYPQKVVEAMSAHKVTGFAGVPSTFSLLLSRVRLSDYDLSSLRYVTQAGGAMSPAITRRLRDALPQTRVFVMYGQTEATARLTWLPPEKLDEKAGSVGIPVRGVEISIRRDDGTAAAALESGEVWAKGASVMQGYWENPDATSRVRSGEWLRTGDLGHLDTEGFLYLVGRRSDMIKTGAHRVHPRDVEDVILELDGIAEVAVVGIEDDILGDAIKAVIVLSEGASVSEMRIKAHCRERLANYKVPKLVEFRSSLPMTVSGKVRRHELAERKIQ